MPNTLLSMTAAVAQWMPHYREAGERYGLCRFLVGAVCSRESGGGVFLVPRGPAGRGDHGHGHGLMQIDGRYHARWLARRLPDGRLAWQDPRENVLYGAGILTDNLRRLGNDLPAAIAAYNASLARVREVQRRLAPTVAPELRARAYDALTTGRDYASDVLARWRAFRAAASLEVGLSAPSPVLRAPSPALVTLLPRELLLRADA